MSIIDKAAMQNFRDATLPRSKKDYALAIIIGLLAGPETLGIWGWDFVDVRWTKSRWKWRIVVWSALACLGFLLVYGCFWPSDWRNSWLDAAFHLVVECVLLFGLIAAGTVIWFYFIRRPRKRVDNPSAMDQIAGDVDSAIK